MHSIPRNLLDRHHRSLIADIMFTFSDFEGADILAQRFKAMLPPAAQSPADQAGIPPEVAAQLQHLQQALQAATRRAHAASRWAFSAIAMA